MIYVITGPTHTKKDELAIELALKIDGQIINADAYHVYKQLKIGTNKPESSDFLNVKHHLFSYVDINEEYSIARYQKDAREIIDQLIKESIPIILLGGSGLYIKAALYNYQFLEEKTVDMKKYHEMDNEALHNFLIEIDPQSASKIHPHNRRRVLRAIEIYLSVGLKKSDKTFTKRDELLYKAMFFGRVHDRKQIYDGSEKRVDDMIENGLIEEVKFLYENYDPSLQALEAIGYKELISYLKNETTLEEAISEIKKNTRRYVKRQMTFCRNQFSMHWVEDVSDILKINKDGK